MGSSGNCLWEDMLVSDGGPYLVDYDGCRGVEYDKCGPSPTLTDTGEWNSYKEEHLLHFFSGPEIMMKT